MNPVPKRADRAATRRSQAAAILEPGADRDAVDHADDRLWRGVHQHRDAAGLLNAGGAFLEDPGGAAAHGLDVAAGTEASAGAGQHDAADRVVGAQAGERFKQAQADFVGQRVQVLGPVEGEGGDAVFDGLDQVGHGAFSAMSTPDQLGGEWPWLQL